MKQLMALWGFISKKRIEWKEPPRKTTRVSSSRIDVNPEIGFIDKGKVILPDFL